MILSEEDYLAHYGILRKSGRYPWGSGKDSHQRSKTFIDMDKKLQKAGVSDVDIAKGFEMTSQELRNARSISSVVQKQAKIQQVEKLKATGMSNSEIGREMGINESTVRSLQAPGAKRKAEQLQSIVDMLERQVKEKGLVQVGTAVELDLPLSDTPGIGVARPKFDVALAMLVDKGYIVDTVKIPQLGTKEMTTVKALGPPGMTQKDMWMKRYEIKLLSEKSEDGGDTWDGGFKRPAPVDIKRVKIIHAEDGGANSDGVIYIRPGVKDLDMGAAQYAQVRINVSDSHYLKGMAVYKADLPKGVDLAFNTNKTKKDAPTTQDALKPLKKGPDGKVDWGNPFGSFPKPGGQRGALNILNEEGDWDKWSKNLPSQMLSKQEPTLIKQQLQATFERRTNSFDEIMGLTNPTVKRKLLEALADEVDSAAVHLKAASMPNQSTKVLLPINSVKPTEVYAPTYKDGERVSLVRFPHGGTFEIPELTVNNRNPEAKKMFGPGGAKDAIGIHAKVAERLSGADFDGDHVILIPNNRGQVKNAPPLEGLKGFDPKIQYRAYDGMKTIDGGVYSAALKEPVYGKRGKQKTMQLKMGDISNLITDMTIKGAPSSHLVRAVRHSMVIIDSEKHMLDYKASYVDNGIAALKERYQGRAPRGTLKGASTLISQAGSDKRVPHFKERPAKDGGPIDRATGKKVFVPTGRTYKDKDGVEQPSMLTVSKLSVTDDAHTLSSGTPQERLYADHSNDLKAFANRIRREYVDLKPIKYEPSSAKVYAAQVDSLMSQLRVAKKNTPLERQAQVIGNAIYTQRVQANPGMDKEEKKKIRNQALAEARERTGASKKRIHIEEDEWAAIQAGAISPTKLKEILLNTDIDRVRELATPRTPKLMSSTFVTRAKAMLANGATQAEVAEQLGVSLTTLKLGLSE